jgi:hypothetical protein
MLAIAGTVLSFNGRTGAVTLTAADISAAGGAPIVSPNFTGVPTAPTPAAGNNSTQIATTAFVMANPPPNIPSSNIQVSDADFSSSITLTLTDNGKVKNCTSVNPVNVVLPANMPKNFYCTFHQANTGQIMFSPASGGALNNRQGFTNSAGRYALCALLVSSNTSGANAQYTLGGDCG